MKIFKINRTICLLMFSDVFVLTGFGLIDPILAIYVKEDLSYGSVFGAAVASTIYMLVKSLVQLPFSHYIDKHSDVQAARWLLLGTVLIATVPFFYIFAGSVMHIYIAQILHGVGSGLAYSAWLGIWSTHLDEHKESFEWSLYSTLVGFGTSLSAIVGGFISQYIGFRWTFALVGALSLCGCLMLAILLQEKRKLLKNKTIEALS